MATGDISSVTILANGWEADIVIVGLSTGGTYAMGLGTNNDPSTGTPKIAFTVVSLGYDSAGVATTVIRTVYGTTPVRKAYPSQTSNEESGSSPVTVRVALSDYIYAKDKTGGGNSGTAPVVSILASFYTQGGTPNNASGAGFAVTNSSTVAYPKVIGHWAVPERLAVNGTEAVEFFAVHKYGTGGKPIAFLTMTATGASSSHTETGTATTMTLSARGDLIPVYAVSLNLSTGAGFTRGELVTIRVTAKPWLGDSSAVLDSTTDAGTQVYQLADLHRTIMSPMYARVDGVGAGSPAASATQGTADANPFATIALAAAGIAAANNSAFSLNRVDGGEIQLNAGSSYTYVSSGTTTTGCVTIKPHSSTNRAGVVLIQSSAAYQSAYLRLYNITITRASNTFLFFAANPNYLVMDSINFNDVRTGWYSGDTNTAIDFIDCISNNSYFSKGGNDGHARLIRNQTYTATTEAAATTCGNASCVLGFHGIGGAMPLWQGITSAGTSNFVFAYSTQYALTDGLCFGQGNPSVDLSNVAIVNNMIERIGAAATPLAEISDANFSNLLLAHNTFAGQRFNMENDIVAAFVNKTFTDYLGKFNSFNARGDHRADILDTDGSMVGTWSIGYSVGWDSNHNEGISYTGDTDFWGLNSNYTAGLTAISPSVPAEYVSDRSKGGTDAGNGDYHVLSAASPIAGKITGSKSILPFDIAGTARTAVDAAGAYHFAAPSSGFFFAQ